MDFHLYKKGYSVLPQLKKIAANDIFIPTDKKDYYREQKELSLSKQKCFIEHNITQEIYDVVCKFILDTYPEKLTPGSFSDIAMQIPEDLAIHRVTEDSDWLAATHVCFPGGWSPEETVGKNFNQIHTVIPGMNLSNSRKLVETMVHNGPFERFLWGLVYEDVLNHHPKAKTKSFDINNPFFMVKTERQITYGFPEVNAFVFILSEYFVSSDTVDKAILHKTLLTMSPEQRKYKGISDDFVNYLITPTK